MFKLTYICKYCASFQLDVHADSEVLKASPSLSHKHYMLQAQLLHQLRDIFQNTSLGKTTFLALPVTTLVCPLVDLCEGPGLLETFPADKLHHLLKAASGQSQEVDKSLDHLKVRRMCGLLICSV